MTRDDSTWWTMIEGVAAGGREDREIFARRYGPLVEAYMVARWRGGRREQDIADAVQEVFFECLRDGGAVTRARRSHVSGFRSFLYAVTKNVALRFEQRAGRSRETALEDEGLEVPVPSDATSSREFDRAWARTIMREALARFETMTGISGRRRAEVLRLRIYHGRPIRDIAKEWNVDAAELHHDYAAARSEFRTALRATLSFHGDGPETVSERDLIEFLKTEG